MFFLLVLFLTCFIFSHDLATTEALKQKYQVLKSQMSESEKCSNHCRQREAFVTEALQRQLEVQIDAFQTLQSILA